MSPNSEHAESISEEILAYLMNHPDAADTLEGISHWWVESKGTYVDVNVVSRMLDTLTEKGDLKVVGVGPSRRYRLCKPREVRYTTRELEHLATTLKEQSSAKGSFVILAGLSREQKTKEAEGLAKALDQDLYRVDLSAVVSKYLGETEKNLELLFARAEDKDWILFFDEADALFGKQSEVKDAHDRHDNIEVDDLMQRIEAFTGIVLMSVNDPEPARVIAKRLCRVRSVIML